MATHRTMTSLPALPTLPDDKVAPEARVPARVDAVYPDQSQSSGSMPSAGGVLLLSITNASNPVPVSNPRRGPGSLGPCRDGLPALEASPGTDQRRPDGPMEPTAQAGLGAHGGGAGAGAVGRVLAGARRPGRGQPGGGGAGRGGVARRGALVMVISHLPPPPAVLPNGCAFRQRNGRHISDDRPPRARAGSFPPWPRGAPSAPPATARSCARGGTPTPRQRAASGSTW